MQNLQPDTTLQGGKYRILSTLGQGGFGITYMGEHTLLNRRVAIKEFFMKESWPPPMPLRVTAFILKESHPPLYTTSPNQKQQSQCI